MSKRKAPESGKPNSDIADILMGKTVKLSHAHLHYTMLQNWPLTKETSQEISTSSMHTSEPRPLCHVIDTASNGILCTEAHLLYNASIYAPALPYW